MRTIITDNEIKLQGMNVLINSLGEVQAERFISLILREPFDYTKWQKKLWADKSIEEISSIAMKYQQKQSHNHSKYKFFIIPPCIGHTLKSGNAYLS